MARDCPDRQRGANWRNDAPGQVPGRGPAGRIGGGDAVDREYEVTSFFKPTVEDNLICYSNSCKSFLAMHPLATAKHLNVLKQHLVAMKTETAMPMAKATAISSPGNVDQPVPLLLGLAVAMIMDVVMGINHVMEALLRLGLEVAAAEVETVMVTANRAVVTAVLRVHLVELLLGSDSMKLHPQAASRAMVMEGIQVAGMVILMAVILLHRAWEHLLVSVVVQAVLVLHLDWVLSSRTTVQMDLLETRHPRRLLATHLPHL